MAVDDFHVIVFSKDRAFQLHEYLRTLRKYITATSGRVRVSVLYHVAKPDLGCRCRSFDKSYERVRALHSDVSFVITAILFPPTTVDISQPIYINLYKNLSIPVENVYLCPFQPQQDETSSF